MGYEELYAAWQPQEKKMRDQTNQLGRTGKQLAKDMELGDLKSAVRNLSAVMQSAAAVGDAVRALDAALSGFDLTAYMGDGDYTRELTAICQDMGIDVKANGAFFEIFPCKIRLDPEAQEVVVDNKRWSRARPQALANEIRVVRKRLYAASFQASTFAKELADVYDSVIQLQTRKTAPDADIYLQTLYDALTPMRRFKREYDRQSFAFDIARLYTSTDIILSDGRHFQFGPSRNSNKAFRILDSEGREQYLATIRFFSL